MPDRPVITMGAICRLSKVPMALDQLATIAQQLAQLAQRLGRHKALGDKAVVVRVPVPVDRDHGFRWKMITQSGGT
jgi:hypothetical protein